LEETVLEYKNKLGRFHKVLMDDSYDEKTKKITEATMIEHKKQLIKHKEEKHIDKTTEVLFSLRLH